MPDREKVINGLEQMLADYAEMEKISVNQKCHTLLYHKAMTEDALALLKEQEWHMLTEDDDGIIHGLPGDDGQYIITDGKDIWIDDYVDGVDDGVWLDSGRDIREIKAWMYMPKLPMLNNEGRSVK